MNLTDKPPTKKHNKNNSVYGLEKCDWMSESKDSDIVTINNSYFDYSIMHIYFLYIFCY